MTQHTGRFIWRTASRLALVVALAGAGSSLVVDRRAAAQGGGPPFAPSEALATLRVEPGLRVDLVAHEPDTTSPIAMDVDEDGRIYVVEMPGYPLDASPSGRIRLLEDRDGDGRIDRASTFADGLELPTGVMRWKQGVLVTAAPDLLYLEDTNGDGRADLRRIVLTGFARTNPQHRVNTPVYGLDNWITLAHEGPAEAIIFKAQFGDSGGPLRVPDPGSPTGEGGRVALPARPRSIRVRLDALDTGSVRVEARSGSSQFGHAFDAWGRYFTLDNANHARHEVIPARYLERNPDLVIERATEHISDHGDAAEVFPITRRPQFEMLSEVGQFTSACSLTLGLSGAWPSRFEASAFVAEPVHNLVHRDRYEAAGATFVARRTRERSEFLASSDPWFRPVNLYGGPDGALYVIDYYRPLIEHPEWTASDRHLDSPRLYEGRDRGRIYRVTPEDAALDPWPRPGVWRAAGDAALVDRLGHRNAWHRRTAQRLLVDRHSAASVPLLERVVRERPSAFARLHALWTLEGLGRLDPALVRLALDDPEPGVRENALQLAEAWLSPASTTTPSRSAVDATLVDAVVARATDSDPRVRFQALATLGGIETDAARAAHERLLLASLDDDWMQAAGLSAPSDRAVRLLERVLSSSPAQIPSMTLADTPARGRFLEHLAAIVAARGRAREIDLAIRPPDLAVRPDQQNTQPASGAAARGARRVAPDVQEAAAAVAEGNRRQWIRAALLRGLARGLRGPGGGRDAVRVREVDVLRLYDTGGMEVRRAALALVAAAGFVPHPAIEAIVARAARTARRAQADPESRADAVALLRLSGAAPHETLLRDLIAPREPEAVQAAAIEALGRLPGESLGRFLIERWAALTPLVRQAAAQALVSDPARTRLLVAALAKGTVQAWTLGFWEKRDLVMHDDPAIRREARALLEERPEARAAVVARYAAALDRQGDAERGRAVFLTVCAACHRRDETGTQNLGPDLATVRHRPLSALLTDILVPGRSIAQRYETWVVERVSGGSETGVLGAQTPTSVTLRLPGRDVVVPRRDIRSMHVLPQSAMPADLDQVIDPQQMADLLRFIVDGR
jgi:putative membrane-bound dehydrogenase-like protein